MKYADSIQTDAFQVAITLGTRIFRTEKKVFANLIC